MKISNHLLAALVGAVAAAALVACSSPEPAAPPVWSQPVQQHERPATPQEEVYGNAELNERRNLEKQLGQPAAITNADGSILVDFAVTDIQPVECDSAARDYPSENGRFLVAGLAVNTYDDPDDMLAMILFGNSWEFIAEDGTAIEASTMAAAVCTVDNAPQLKPNRKYAFQVVLDVPDAPGSVSWTTGWTAGNAGWEWAAPGENG